MNDMTTFELARQLTDFWHGAVLARLFVGGVGALIGFGAVQRVVDKRALSVNRFSCMVFGILLISFAVWPNSIIRFLISIEYVTRARILTGVIGFVVLLTAIEGIRRTKLLERYAILWVLTSLVLIACAVLAGAVRMIQAGLGMNYEGAVFGIGFVFLILVSYSFSISLSRERHCISRMSQEIALLRNQVHDLNERVSALSTQVDAVESSPGGGDSEG
jgi:prepilin signal peptidase PulO-like enzyme (type II secretory pathway)